MKNKLKNSSRHTRSKTKNINSYGYDVSRFSVLDIPVRRDSKTGRLVSVKVKTSKKNTFK